ncbi:F5/8 type C domain-containing protein [Catellatospora citrea]|nr:F5/8 type C domain-containing protein [Catellatospora citrea]
MPPTHPRPTAHGVPELILVKDAVQVPLWWRADPRVFSVLIQIETGSRILAGSGEIEPGQLGEVIAARMGEVDRPILLTGPQLAGHDVCQRIADQTQSLVISGAPGSVGWWVTRPRQVGRHPVPPERITGPFPPADVDPQPSLDEASPPANGISEPSMATSGTVPVLDLRTEDASGHHEQCADVRLRHQTSGQQAVSGLVRLGHSLDPNCPFRLFGLSASVWFTAAAIAAREPGWIGRGQPIALDVRQVTWPSLQLLANYLQTPVTVSADRTIGAGSSDGWVLAQPRRARGSNRPQNHASPIPSAPATAAPPPSTPLIRPTPHNAIHSPSGPTPYARVARRRAAIIAIVVVAAAGALTARAGVPRDALANILTSSSAAAASSSPEAEATTATGLPNPAILASPAAQTGMPRPVPGRPTPNAATPTAPPPATGRPNTSARNLAAGRPVTASSAEDGARSPSLAVDGDITSRWGSAFGSDPQWISVDLGAVWSVSDIRLSWEAAYATAYRVEVSRNGSDWSTAFTTAAGSGGLVDIALSPVPARYVRVFGTSRNSIYGYSLYELEVR